METAHAAATPSLKKSRALWWVLGIVVVLAAVLGSAYFAFAASSDVPAQLHVEKGSVSVNGNPVSGVVLLKQGDVIATADGTASVLLYESVVVHVQPNSQVTIDDLARAHPRVSEQQGTTWSTFSKLAGVVDYSISTEKTVASVRGTMFSFALSKIVTAEGVVDYTWNGQHFTVNEGSAVDNGVARDATPEELAAAQDNLRSAIAEFQRVRQVQIDKHQSIINTAMKMYGVDNAFVQEKLASADKGAFDIDALLAKAPVKPAWLVKVAAITKEIQHLNQLLDSLSA
jgi:hypothetical protein